MNNKILVITATLGNRDTLERTITSVKSIGGNEVKHVLVAPKDKIPYLTEKYGDIECIPEPEGKGIYTALNHGFNLYGREYKYLTFINDDDFWLPNFSLLINCITNEDKYDLVYGKTSYVNEYGIKIGSQTSSGQLKEFLPLVEKGIILFTQQATIIKSDLYFKIGGFDESYKLVADTKFWMQISLLDIKYKYIDKECAAYMIQSGQLSSDKTTQKTEHVRLMSEEIFPQKVYKSSFASLKFRISNITIYLKRFSRCKGFIKKPLKIPFPLKCLIVVLPWKLKRFFLNKYLLYNLHPKARIGFSYIFPDYLEMEEGACIGHLNVAIHLNKIIMKKNSSIRQQNWITGYPLTQKKHFQDFPNRKPELIMDEDSGITKKHLVDCTDRVTIGRLTSVAGYNTQILTHSTSLEHNKQSCAPITIGHHCFVGTRSIILPGAVLPDQSVLGAGAVLKKQFSEPFALYGGVPAKFIKKIDETYSFFHRTVRPK